MSDAETPQYTVQRRDYHPGLKLANFFAAIINRLGFKLGKLDQQEVLAAARRRMRLDDWGDESFLDPMGRIFDAMNGAGFTDLAMIIARQSLITSVANRLRVEDYIRRHPEVEEIPIRRPLFILGFPRTGTTLLQNLLSLDEGARALQFWELITPVPEHSDPDRDRKIRQKRAKDILRAALFVAPEQKYVHDVRWNTAEECWPLFSPSFCVMNYDLQSGFTDYGAYLMGRDMTGPYREYKRQLQILAHWHPTDRFILKCPEHLWFLDALLEVFPDACVVWTHRDPADSVASYCSMMSMNYRTFYGRFEPEFIGRHITERFHIGVERAMQARARADPSRFFDADFKELVQDPGGMVRKIKTYFDIPHPEGSDAAIRGWLDSGRHDKKGRHVYDAARYGLDPSAIHERYADYIERFSIPLKAR